MFERIGKFPNLVKIVFWMAAGSLAFWLVYPDAYLNYDAFYGLLWAKDLTLGHLPDYTFPIAPTPHPLATLVSMIAVPFGSGADDLLLAISFVAFSLLLIAVFRLGTEVFSRPVGLFAALIVATRQPIDSLVIRAYVDIPFLALILWAAVVEVRRPKCGAPVLVLLLPAGLLRPEAWPIAAVYYIYLVWDSSWAQRIKLGLLAAAAPVLWALTDLIVTGNPLHSLTGTSDLAAQLDRPRTLLDLPTALPEALGYVLREPVLIAIVPGLIFAWLFYRRRQLVPVALIVLNLGTFVMLAVVELPLLARYILLASIVLTLYAAAAAVGWTEIADRRNRRNWGIVGVAVLAIFLAFIPSQAGRLKQLRESTIARGQMQEDIRSLTQQPDAKRLFDRCHPVYAPNHRLVPMLRYWLKGSTDDVLSGQSYPIQGGIMIAPRTPTVRTTFVLNPTDQSNLNTAVPDDYKRLAKNRSWAIYASPECLQLSQAN